LFNLVEFVNVLPYNILVMKFIVFVSIGEIVWTIYH